MLLLYLLAVLHCSYGSQVTVNTSLGAVHGFHVDYGDNVTQLYSGKADVFLGIPYAIPPVGKLRFRLPRRICTYGPEGIDATAYGPSCPQDFGAEPLYAHGSPRNEDCLLLNVMSPEATGGKKYPVMVWIHGGGYVAGSAYTYDYKGGIRNFVSKGVVLVTIQYRLDVIGFFTTLSEEFPANRGIFDQLMALRWVQEEIGFFGGDPSQVTIFGESAGGCAVSALSLSPLAHNLFHRVIQQSGGELLLHLTMDSPLPTLDRHTTSELCNFTENAWAKRDFSSLAECMKDINWRNFIYVTRPKSVHGFSVYSDGFLFPDTLKRLAKKRPNYPTLLGNVQNEMTFFIYDNVAPDSSGKPTNLSAFNSSIFAAYIVENYPYLTEKSKQLADIMSRVYKRERKIADNDHLEWFKLAVEALGDMKFTNALRFDATNYAANGNEELFIYTYDYMSVFGGNVTYGGWRAVPHASELRFLWKFKFDWEPAAEKGTITEDDKAIADFLSNAWTSFAIKKNPGWTAVSSPEQMEFYRIMAPQGRVETEYMENAHVVFNSVFESLLGEFPPQNNGAAAQKWLEEHYVPKIRAEYERSLKCDGEGPTPESTPEPTGTTSESPPDQTTSPSESTTSTTTSINQLYVTSTTFVIIASFIVIDINQN